MSTCVGFRAKGAVLFIGIVSIVRLSIAQEAVAAAPEVQSDSIPVTQLIATVARKTGKKFIVDPRVRADVVLIGQSPAAIDYAGLLEVLQVHGFTAAEDGGYVRVVPVSSARTLPLVSGRETHPDAQYVTKLIPVKTLPAVSLVPLLRPMIPQEGHLVAVVCTNVLIVVDTFGNANRISQVVEALDVGAAYTPEKCTPAESGAPRPGQ